MSKVKIQGNASGTGVVTLTAPNTNTDRAITLPDAAGTLLMTDGDGSNLIGLSHTPEGTAVLSTGETGGTKYLREDGDGTSSWQAVAGGGAMEYISTQTISSNTTQVEFDLSDTDYEYFVVKAEGCKVASSPSNGYFVYFNFYDGAYNSSSPTTNKMNFMYQRTQADGSSVTTSTQFASDAKLFVSWTPSTSTVFGFDAEVGGKLNSRVNIQSNMVTGTTNAGSPSCQAQCPNTSNNMTYMIIKLASVDFSAGTFKLYGIKD